MIDTIILIIIIIIIFNTLNILLRKKKRAYENYENQKIIWMYWETLPGKKKPGYIDLCINSVKFNCGKCFKIIVLDNKSITKYLPEIEKIDFSNLNLPSTSVTVPFVVPSI